MPMALSLSFPAVLCTVFLVDRIFTIYTRNLPLDVACRIWDLFCRDGDVFLYRTALGKRGNKGTYNVQISTCTCKQMYK